IQTGVSSMKRFALVVLWSTILFVATSSAETSPIRVLLVDGQSAGPYHNWQLTTRVLKRELDRKSTRLNSSHLGISNAVFCLKKKNVAPINPDYKHSSNRQMSFTLRRVTSPDFFASPPSPPHRLILLLPALMLLGVPIVQGYV